MNQLTNLKSLILIPLALACFALAPKVIAIGIPVSCNTSEGFQALDNNTTGTGDTAFGGEALFSNTDGFENTAVGCSALSSNTVGNENTALGSQALLSNSIGLRNTAVGSQALFSNTTGFENTADGSGALFFNTTGHDNTAVGLKALLSNTSGTANTALGFQALVSNTFGGGNTAIGYFALWNNTGDENIALGDGAGSDLTDGNNNIDIGNPGQHGESDTIRIGVANAGPSQEAQTATYIAGIFGTTVVGSPVFVTSFGKLGVGGPATSSARFKDEIKPMDKTSEAILALKPVTFRYKKELDPKGVPQFGLVAEEVEKVNPDLITRDRDGNPYTVRYEVVNAMLLNEFLKEHRKVEQQDRRLEQQERTIAKQQKQIEALTAGLQKVSTQLELSKPAPQMVVSNQ